MKLHWSLAHLGLPGDADARAVKRAYATKLKTTRPEDDPEGFQRLHEAYQAALDWMQSRETDIDIDIDADIDTFAEDAQSGAVTLTLSQDMLFERLGAQSDAPFGMPALAVEDAFDEAEDRYGDRSAIASSDAIPSEASARFDPGALIDDCIASAMHAHDSELLNWLNAQPALWSLAHKTRIAPWLLQRLHERRPPIEARRFDTLAEFFGLLDLHSGYDAYTIHRLRHRLQLAWEIETRQTRALAERTAQDGGSMAANLRQAGRILGQLSRPLHWPQALWAGLMPGYPSAVRSFLRRLDYGNLDDLPAAIREEQIAFWNAAGDRSRFSIPRWAVSVARLFAYTLAIALVFALFTTTTSSGSPLRATPIVDVIGGSFATMLAGWLSYLAYDAFMRWQALPESATSRSPWLRAASIPILGVGALAAAKWLDLDEGGSILCSLAVFLLALQRYRRRNDLPLNTALKFRIWYVIPFFFGVVVLVWISESNSFLLSLGITGVALALWALDMRKQRAALRN
ncbi:MAG: hypothetical protein V4673_07850 [Pseudomonadota bacterium]